jgi:hypothetical protein
VLGLGATTLVTYLHGGEGSEDAEYIKKVIYCGSPNIVVLPVYFTTLICVQKRNKMARHLILGLFTVPCNCKVL